MKDFKNVEGFWDTILISLFGYEEIDIFSKHCNQLIVIVNDKVNPHIPIWKYKSEYFKIHSYENLKSILEERKINYTVEKHSLEFGQTFNSMDEISEYAASYDDEYEEIYNHIKNNITRDEKIPYYLPYKKEFSIFTINFNNK